IVRLDPGRQATLRQNRRPELRTFSPMRAAFCLRQCCPKNGQPSKHVLVARRLDAVPQRYYSATLTMRIAQFAGQQSQQPCDGLEQAVFQKGIPIQAVRKAWFDGE